MEISVRQMYDTENAGAAMGFPKLLMMENAGAAAVRRLREARDVSSESVLVVAGLGNNGGDGLVMARHLAGYGARVSVVLLGSPGDIKTAESRSNYSILEKMPSVSLFPRGADPGERYHTTVDAVLGTGISGDIREPFRSAMVDINQSGSFVVSVDVPSGMDPDTGKTADVFVRADMTVTFHRMKRGMPGRPDVTGRIHVERIGIPPEADAV